LPGLSSRAIYFLTTILALFHFIIALRPSGHLRGNPPKRTDVYSIKQGWHSQNIR
jgi:hypothetical protein